MHINIKWSLKAGIGTFMEARMKNCIGTEMKPKKGVGMWEGKLPCIGAGKEFILGLKYKKIYLSFFN